MEELGVAAAEDVGFQWVLGAILAWVWNTFILVVGRIALALELILLLPRMYRLGGQEKEAGSWAAFCRKVRASLPVFAGLIAFVIVLDWWLLGPWMAQYPYGTEDIPETLSESMSRDGLEPLFSWAAQLFRIGVSVEFTLLWPRAFFYFRQHDSVVTMMMFYRRRASPKHRYDIIEVDYGGGGHRTRLRDQ